MPSPTNSVLVLKCINAAVTALNSQVLLPLVDKVNLTQDVHENPDTSLAGSYREQEIRFTSAWKCTQLEYNRQEGNCSVAFGRSILLHFCRVSRPRLQ